MQTINCGICGRVTPVALKNSHHIKPQAAGGGPDDTTPLCAGCHQNLHLIANMLMGPKANLVQSTISTFYQNEVGAQQRCLTLAVEVVRWMTSKKNGQIQDQAHEDVVIEVRVPAAVRKGLTLLGRSAKDVRSGRMLGMEGAARKILVDNILKQFPDLRQEIEQSFQKAQQNPTQQRGPEPSAAIKRSLRK